MSQLEIATAYEAASKIVVSARCKNVNIVPVWRKLDRISKYLDNTATSLLSETLS